jgi:hypothetical protein
VRALRFPDERALRFHHVKPVRRGLNGLSKKALSSTETHRAIVRGEGKGIRLLCANCSVITCAGDTSINANIRPAATSAASARGQWS